MMDEEQRKRVHQALRALRRATVTCVEETELWEILHDHEEALVGDLRALYERRGWGTP